MKLLNRAAERLTDWTGEEAQGQPVTEVLRLIDKRTGRPEPRQWLESTGRETMVDSLASIVLVTRTGRHVNIETTIAPINEASGSRSAS